MCLWCDKGIEMKDYSKMTLDDKVKLTKERMLEWSFFFRGAVWVSFSCGKDSTVMLDLARELFPDIPAVYVNTGIEHPANVEFSKTVSNLIMLRPELSFKQILNKYGYPIGGKKIARSIRDLQNPTDRNKATRNLHLTGVNRKGEFHKSSKLANRWVKLANITKFKISEQCCWYLKEKPLVDYSKKTKAYPFVGVRSAESGLRKMNHKNFGCNLYESRHKMSRPIIFWTNQDTNTYIERNNIKLSEAYTKYKEHRTGCNLCPNGAHLEKGEERRFLRLKRDFPKWHNCLYTLKLNKLFDEVNSLSKKKLIEY